MSYTPKTRIGSMRQRVTIQEPTESQDATGQPVVTWSDWIVDEPAEYMPTSGIESMRGLQLEAKIKAIFRVNYRSGYTTQMKVVHDGTSYGILHINPVEGGRRFIELFTAASGDL